MKNLSPQQLQAELNAIDELLDKDELTVLDFLPDGDDQERYCNLVDELKALFEGTALEDASQRVEKIATNLAAILKTITAGSEADQNIGDAAAQFHALCEKFVNAYDPESNYKAQRRQYIEQLNAETKALWQNVQRLSSEKDSQQLHRLINWLLSDADNFGGPYTFAELFNEFLPLESLLLRCTHLEQVPIMEFVASVNGYIQVIAKLDEDFVSSQES